MQPVWGLVNQQYLLQGEKGLQGGGQKVLSVPLNFCKPGVPSDGIK